MKNSHLMTLVVLFFFTASLAFALDPSRYISQYGHTAWRMQDGFFGGTPAAIVQSQDGFLWVATETGLLRFDGVRFVPWTPPDGKRLPSASITSLHAAQDGSLWIGTEAGPSHWKNGDLIAYPSGYARINRIIEGRNGSVWFSHTRVLNGSGPLCQIVDTVIRCLGKADGIPPDITGGVGLAEDRLGNLWMGTDIGLLRWKPGSVRTYNPPGLKFNANLDGVSSLALKPDGSLWVGIDVRGPGLGLQQLVGDDWKPFATPEFDGSSLNVQTLFLDSQNALWIGTADGIYRIYGNQIDHYRSADGLSSDSVLNFYEDREGSMWVTTAKGIDSFHDLRVATFSKHEGLNADEADAVIAARDGTIWIGSSGGLDALRQGRISFIQTGKGLPGNQVTVLFEDHTGQLWVGIDNTLTIYSNGHFSPVKMPDGGPIGFVISITEDREHNIWAAISNPQKLLVRIQNRRVLETLPTPKLPPISRIAAAPQGGIWLGLYSGDLARFHDGKLDTFLFKHAPNQRVKQLYVDSDGAVLGATASGLIAWKNGRQQVLTTQNGLPCDNVNGLILDDGGALWLYMECGIVQIAQAELQKWWDHPETALELRLFDTFDGVQPGFAPFKSAAKSPDGRLWFVNGFALQMLDPAHLSGNLIPPPVHIEEIVADRKIYHPRNDLLLPPLTRDLEIDYTALSFMAPQKVRFRYRLEGHDSAWQEPGTRRQAFYNDLQPGKYRFYVIACNNDGVWNETGAALNFSIKPMWYQTKLFIILTVVFGALITWVIFRLRVRQIATDINARFDERLDERTRLAREFHDTFLQTIQGSKMVADDALDESTDPARMRRALEKLSAWMGQATKEGRAALNSLRASTTQRNDLAEAIQRAVDDCAVRGSVVGTCSVEGAVVEMHPIMRDEIYRIGYEAIRNTCQHSGATRLDVHLHYARDLFLSVQDNGRGIAPEILANGKEGHFGLQGMRERAARIGGKLHLSSSPSSGTLIELTVSGNIVFRRRTPVQALFMKIRALGRRSGRATVSQ